MTKSSVLSLCLLLGTASMQAAIAAEQSVQLPFAEDFSENSIPDGWEVTSPTEAPLAVKDGLVVFEAGAHQFAGIQRRLELEANNVTATARIHDAATLYLVWGDGDDFVGVGKVSPTPFARFHSIVQQQGKPEEVDHSGCHGPTAHLMRIQLGKDCIRFQCSHGDGEPKWRTLRTIERGPEFAGVPKLLVVGKNYGVEESDETFVATDSVGRGNRGLLAKVEIAQTPADAASMTSDERRWLKHPKLDPVTALVVDGDRDPTYEEVAQFHPEMKYKREIVGVPGQRNDIGTDWLGRIDASPWEGPIAWFEIGEKGLPFADKPEDVKHRLLDGYVPIVNLDTSRDGADYDMTVFGWAEDFSPTADLYTYVRLTAWNNGETADLPKTIAITGKEQKKVAFKPETTPSGMMTLCVRFKHPDPKTAEQISEKKFEAHRAKAETAWRDRLAKCSPFDVPDPRVNEAYRAWIAYCLLNTDVVDGLIHVHDGAGFYDLVFGHSMSRHSTLMTQLGDVDYAASMLESQLHFLKPDGHYIQECGLPDQGALVMAIANHFLLTKDADWLQRHSERLTRACNWIIARRDEAPKEGLCRGLIKFRPYNDYNDPVFNYMGNVLCCQGLELSAKALREIGRYEEADSIAAEGAAFRKDILQSMDNAVTVQRGVRMLPIEPDTHRLLKLTKYKGGEYYGLVASDITDTSFFPKNDPREQLLVNMLENEGGLAAGVCEFQEGIDHAYTGGYLMGRLRHGEVRKFLLGFWSMMAYGSTRDTYSPVEVTLYKTGENHYTLPHTYSCTQQLHLLRSMLLREEGDELIIAQGTPRAWLEPSKHIEVTDAPTLFGPASYRIESKDSDHLSIHLDPPVRDRPAAIEIHLRHPGSRKIESVDSSAKAKVMVDGDVIRLEGVEKPLDLRVKFEE